MSHSHCYTYVSWDACIGDVTNTYVVSPALFMWLTWHDSCDMSHSYVWRDSCMRKGDKYIHMSYLARSSCDMTQACVSRDRCTCDIDHTHILYVCTLHVYYSICVYMHTNLHTRSRTHTQTDTRSLAHTHTHTRTQARTHMHAHTRTHAHTHTRTHAHTHTHTHTHTHSMVPPASIHMHARERNIRKHTQTLLYIHKNTTVQMCDMTNPYVAWLMYTYHDLCTCTLLAHDSSICDMTHAMTHPCIHVWQDSRLCDTTHVHAHYSCSIWMRMSCVHVHDSYHEGTSHVTYDTHTHTNTHTHIHTHTHTHT